MSLTISQKNSIIVRFQGIIFYHLLLQAKDLVLLMMKNRYLKLELSIAVI